MSKLLLLAVVAVAAAIGLARARSGKGQTDLWHEATTPVAGRHAAPERAAREDAVPEHLTGT
ncbi:MAG: DLW-39 family protein [Mycobacteriaceae bacterium]